MKQTNLFSLKLLSWNSLGGTKENHEEFRKETEKTSQDPTMGSRAIDNNCNECNGKVSHSVSTNSAIKTKLCGFSPRVNYTDRATATCRRSWCQLLPDIGCHVVSATDPHGRILGSLDRSRYIFISSRAPKFQTRGSGPPCLTPNSQKKW
jgi:hypothetical protein